MKRHILFGKLARLAFALLWLKAGVAATAETPEESAAATSAWIDPDGISGALVIVGGGQFPEGARDKFFELAGGKQAKIVVVPTASADADQAATDEAQAAALLEPWKGLGAASVAVFHAASKDKANDEAFTAPLREATGVWIVGGQQTRLADAYLGTLVEKELTALLARGGVIGGTSAGAAVMTKTMIAGGNPEPEMASGFDLLPGCIVDQHFLARNRKPRLLAAVAAHPGLVGVGVDEGTALVVKGRELRVLGQSTVTIILGESANQSRPPREIDLKAGSTQDLTMLRRAAFARTQDPFPPKECPSCQLEKGSLVIVGGGGMPRPIVDKFIELAGGPDGPIVVLPTANPMMPGARVDRREGTFFERAGAKDVTILPQRTRAEVESPEFEAALKRAKGVWFGGGRQWRFIDCYAGTKAEALLKDVLNRGGVIGGSSAGATIQGDYLVRGSVLGNEEMMAEGYERGLGYLPGCAIDQHFGARNRFADLTTVMQRHPQMLGIGIDEATALIVQGKTALIMGQGNAYFYDYWLGPPSGEKDYLTVKAGEKFDLLTRQKVAPEE